MSLIKIKWAVLILLVLMTFPLAAEDDLFSFSGTAEIGFLGFFSHTIRFGSGGTEFDYVRDGGQDLLFPFSRLSAEIGIGSSHSIIFLYQPIDVRTAVSIPKDVIVENVTFPGTPGNPAVLDLRYGFDFYRVSYLYDFLKSPGWELSAGASLQFRDAAIDFAAADGTALVANRDVGPVPILKFRAVVPVGSGAWIGAEADGFYASNKFFNGAEYDFEGSILDASLRAGFAASEGLDAFVNFRFLGGTAKGVDSDEAADGDGDDGSTSNRLATYSMSLGVTSSY